MFTPLSTRAQQTLAAFGLTIDDVRLRARLAPERRIAHAAAHIDHLTNINQLSLLTGPSGSGKSRILEALASLARTRPSTERIVTVEPASRMLRFRATAVDVVSLHRGPRAIDDALSTLSAAGLADARLMVTPVHRMSEGERARVSLARAIDRAASLALTHGVTLIADEFVSSLDSITARSVAALLARWVRRPGSNTRAIIATNRDEAAAALHADHLIHLPCAWAW